VLLKLKLDVLRQCRLWRLEGIDDWERIRDRLSIYLKEGDRGTVEKIIASPVNRGRADHKEPTTRGNDGLEGIIELFLKARSAEYKPETARKYRILLTVWQQFEAYRKKKLCIDELSYTVMEEFRLYLLNVRKNRNDTIYKMLASLKCLIRWMLMNNYPVDRKCLELRQSVKSKHEIVTLSEAELFCLRNTALKPELRVIRDIFLFMVYTGQRYSDMQQLNPTQVKDNSWSFTSIKTGKNITVPFFGWCKGGYDIARRYDFRFPRYTQQYFNRALKKICKEAKLTETVSLKRYKGRSTIIVKQPKYNLISSHTARRTAISLLLSKGVPPTIVMKLTGHSDIKTMMRYERTTNEALVNALQLLEGK